jgi:hypothetical protein
MRRVAALNLALDQTYACKMWHSINPTIAERGVTMTNYPVTSRESAINVVALGTALSAALVFLYVICALAELVFPNLPLAHGWVALFSVHPVGTVANWAAGIVGSMVFGWITAVVLGLVYNKMDRNY